MPKILYFALEDWAFVSACLSPSRGPQASQNIGYADHFMHKYWHFIDTPFSPDKTKTLKPETPNA